jgi:hypothetical protein
LREGHNAALIAAKPMEPCSRVRTNQIGLNLRKLAAAAPSKGLETPDVEL